MNDETKGAIFIVAIILAIFVLFPWLIKAFFAYGDWVMRS